MGCFQVKYLLDTHVWVWWNMRPENLSRKVYSLLESAENYDELLLSAISPWEFSKLIEKKRIGISCNPEEWIAEGLRMPKLRLIPLTPRISYLSTALPQPFHDDPADQIIVATAREEKTILITKDKLLQDYEHIKTFW